MLQRTRSSVTPQGKLISVQNKFGNLGIKKQQGTTRTLYDSLPVDGSTEFRFFEESSARTFPFTNTGASGNKLTVGESMVIERIYLSLFTEIAGVVTAQTPASTLASFDSGEIVIAIANSVVMKPVSTTSFNPFFNKNAYWDGYNNFEFDTQLTISPLVEFVISLRIPTQALIANTFIRLTIEGVGSILATRNTM